MQKFADHIKEHMDGEGLSLPVPEAVAVAVDLRDSDAREAINFTLSDITDSPEALDPVVVYERVRQALNELGYPIPSSTEHLDLFSEQESDADKILALAQGVFLYFAFTKEDSGYYEVLAEVVNESELEEILSDTE